MRFAFLRDHGCRRTRDEIRIGELGARLGQFGLQAGDFLSQALAFRSGVHFVS